MSNKFSKFANRLSYPETSRQEKETLNDIIQISSKQTCVDQFDLHALKHVAKLKHNRVLTTEEIIQIILKKYTEAARRNPAISSEIAIKVQSNNTGGEAIIVRYTITLFED